LRTSGSADAICVYGSGIGYLPYGPAESLAQSSQTPKADAMPAVMGPRRAQFRLLPIKSVLLLTRE
jgi:hypothetical protein